jgi:hypothetical protein
VGYGPERATFTMEEPADYATFNSLTNNSALGDERNFVRVRELDCEMKYRNLVCVVPGRKYEVYIYYHNNAKSRLNQSGEGVARNVRVFSNLTKNIINKDTPTKIFGVIRSDNTNPPEIWDSSALATDCEDDIELQIIDDSVELHQGPIITKLPQNEFFSESGTLIGNSGLDGTIFGCAEFSGYITYKLLAVKVKDKNHVIKQNVTKYALNSLSEIDKKRFVFGLISGANKDVIKTLKASLNLNENWTPSDIMESDISLVDKLYFKYMDICG